MEERRWPKRYRVTIHTNGGNSIPYSATTWLSPNKAIAMAVAAHLDRHHPGTGPMGIRDVEVADLGPVPRNADGKMVIEGSDLVDRMEF